MLKIILNLVLFCSILMLTALFVSAGEPEYLGQFDSTLVANEGETEQVIFKLAKGLQDDKKFSDTAHVTSGRLYNPQTDKYSILSLLVEEQDEKPFMFVDLNGDGAFTDNEKFVLKREEKDNPYLWIATVNIPTTDKLFTNCPIFVRYFRSFKTDKMTEGDRLFQQSTEVFARGSVDVKGKKVLVQYAYNFADKKVSPNNGWLGIDTDEDGKIDMDSLSPEASRAKEETVIFRVGELYLSTKKVDLGKNQIVMRENKASDYARFELGVGKEMTDFSFVDFKGKKRKLSEFRGKYVLLDIWGLWCPACRDEMPYLRESYKRFQPRGLEIIGLNTDTDFQPEQIQETLNKNGMNWTQARFDSVIELLAKSLRISSFPTTMLISPDGKILSMSRNNRKELDLRGKELLETLDKTIP